MSRLIRTLHGIASGYTLLAMTALFNLATVPLALHFLLRESWGVEKFALWTLMMQVVGYITLIDLGMSSSLARLLIDHKDQRAGTTYGSLLLTGWTVSVVQGLIVFAAGFLLAPWCVPALKIDPQLAGDFIALLRWQCTIVAINFAARIFGQLLYAHQRLDVVNYAGASSLLAGFAAMWTAFQLGQGVASVIWANAASGALNLAIVAVTCQRLKLFPSRGAWGRVRWHFFTEVFGYGKDLFLVALGTQLIMTSQSIIIARNTSRLGLQAVALWAVGTKLFQLISQVVWRVSDSAAPAFGEMIVREERDRLAARYRAVAILTASLAGAAAVASAMCNGPFVQVYTRGAFRWEIQNDFLLGAWMVVLAVLHSHNSFVLLTKKLGFLRYVYLVEGLLFFGAGTVAAKWAGFSGLITVSVLCSATITCAYGMRRMVEYFRLPWREVAWQWQVPMLRVLLVLAPVAVATGWLTADLRPWAQLVVRGAVLGTIGALALLRLGLPPEFQTEILARGPKVFGPFLRRVFALS